MDDNKVKLGKTEVAIALLPFGWFIKKPVLVRAMQADCSFRVNTLHGTVTGKKGDYIVMDIENRPYPCKKSIFEETHEKAMK
jgi:hypothetical protein